MLLIYIKTLTPRINYTFRQVCSSILGYEVGFTSKIEEFVAHEGMKISYGKQKMGNEFFIQEAGLLNEQGFNDTELKFHEWENTTCFFKVSDKSDVPFDIFSASFYLLSRLLRIPCLWMSEMRVNLATAAVSTTTIAPFVRVCCVPVHVGSTYGSSHT